MVVQRALPYHTTETMGGRRAERCGNGGATVGEVVSDAAREAPSLFATPRTGIRCVRVPDCVFECRLLFADTNCRHTVSTDVPLSVRVPILFIVQYSSSNSSSTNNSRMI